MLLVRLIMYTELNMSFLIFKVEYMKHWCMIYSIELMYDIRYGIQIEFATDPKCYFIFESWYIYIYKHIFIFIYIYIYRYTYKYCIAFLFTVYCILNYSGNTCFLGWSFPIPRKNILAGWSGCNSVSVWDEPLRNGYRFCAVCEGDRAGVAAWGKQRLDSNEISIQKVCGIGLKHQLALDSNDPITWRL